MDDFRIEVPDFDSVVGGAGGEMFDVGGEEDASYISCVGGEHGYGDESRDVAALLHLPDVDVSLKDGLECCKVKGYRCAK